jgi:hypothetical protein
MASECAAPTGGGAPRTNGNTIKLEGQTIEIRSNPGPVNRPYADPVNKW